MKDIAEYFRNLSADDRHFGAEPITPDPEMLARLAQRNGGGSIEATRDGNAFLLKATESEDTPAVEEAEEAADTDAPAASKKKASGKKRAKKAPAKKPAKKPAAAKPMVEVAEDATEEDVKADDTAADETPDALVEDTSAAPSQDDIKTDDNEPFAPVDLSATDQYEEDYASELTLDTASADTDDLPSAASVSAKLQRIRAVVSRQQDSGATDVSDRDDTIASSIPPEDELTFDESGTTTEDTLESIQDRMGRAQAEASDDLDAEAATEAEDLGDLSKMDGWEADAEADSDAIRASLENALDTDQLSNRQGDAEIEETVEGLDLSDGRHADLDDATDEEVTDEDDIAEPAEAELSEDLPGDIFAGVNDDADVPKPRRVRITGAPSEDEADMDRIMEQTEKQMSAPDTSRRRAAISQLKAAVAATEAARDLGDDQTQRKATEKTFREDLKQVVRPTRPIRPVRPLSTDAASASGTERPDANAPTEPAPLKLVASQRIIPEEPFSGISDSDDGGAPRTPVRSRRIDVPTTIATSADTSGPVDTDSFAGFASDMGAEGLAQLLEAAAAYSVYVEGSDNFSRPQLMNKVKDVPGADYSREEGLRAFGTLLREGKINKVSNGRFNVSQDTAYNPASRAS